MKIILSGGGTLGPVSPLLAIFEIYQQHNPDCRFIWIGTKHGAEKKIVEQYNIPFFVIASGKLRRYFSLWNVVDIFKIIIGFFQSLAFLIQEKPNLLITAGGFVSVPLHLAASLLGIPTWVHQQDVRVGLANKLMKATATKITTALESSLKNFKIKKTEWIGNPVRDLTVKNLSQSRKKFNIPENSPVIFVFGGGTGSDKLNSLVIESLPHLNKNWHIIHLTGKKRPDKQAQGAINTFKNYHPYKFFTEEMKDAYAISSVVVGRGGFVTITELASLSKPAVLLPMSDTHQEENVKMLSENQAAIIMDEKKVNSLDLAHTIKKLIDQPDVAKFLGEKLHNTIPPAKLTKIISIINQLTTKYFH